MHTTLDLNQQHALQHRRMSTERPPPSWTLCILAAGVCGKLSRGNPTDHAGILMFAFCAVFAVIMVGSLDPQLIPWLTAANLLAAFLSGILISCFSGAKISIAGPDINVVIFFATAVQATLNDWYYENPPSLNEQIGIIVTIMVLFALSLALAFYVIGKFQLTRVIQYIPAPVISGFLLSVGFSVFREAISVATNCQFSFIKPDAYQQAFGSWDQVKLFLPALVLGLLLYGSKRFHWKPTTVVLPLLLLTPLLVFFSIVFILNKTLDDAREAGWLEHHKHSFFCFFNLWQLQAIGLSNFSLKAIQSGLGTTGAMIIVGSIDLLLKLAAIERTYGFELSFDKEVKLTGKTNFLLAALGCVPAYTQFKFMHVNHGIINSLSDRRVGILTACFCGVIFLSGFPLINYVPNFFLSGLLVYASLGFIVDHGIESRQTLSKKDFIAVWIILATKLFFDFLYAVAAGLVLATFSFAHHYAVRSEAKSVFTAKEYHSRVLRSYTQILKLESLASRVVAIQLQGLLFFGSTSKIQSRLQTEISNSNGLPRHLELRYFLIDFEHVVGMDVSSVGIFVKILRTAHKANIKVIFTAINPREMTKLRKDPFLQQELESNAIFGSLDNAFEFVEQEILTSSRILQSKWFIFDKMKQLHCMSSWQSGRDGFDEILDVHGETLRKYCSFEILEKGTVLYRASETLTHVYILENGKITLTLVNKFGTGVEKIVTITKGALCGALISPISFESATLVAKSCVIAIPLKSLEQMRVELPDVWGLLNNECLKFLLRVQRMMEYHLFQGSARETYLNILKSIVFCSSF